jgi:hypothetical protein
MGRTPGKEIGEMLLREGIDGERPEKQRKVGRSGFG